MKFNIITLFPDFFSDPLRLGVVGQAVQAEKLDVRFINPRDFTQDVHKTVDDRPFGGGDGMVMQAEPLKKSLESLSENRGKVVYLSPQGELWNDRLAREWAALGEPITLICGRYAGVDQRFINQYVDQEISIGDYVLSGGEPAALVVVDCVARLLEGVLGNEESPHRESFSGEGWLEAPQFTRPREVLGQKVPEVLLSGHHSHILEWQQKISLVKTCLRRPDLVHETVGNVKSAIRWALARPDEELRTCGIEPERLRQLSQKLELYESSADRNISFADLAR